VNTFSSHRWRFLRSYCLLPTLAIGVALGSPFSGAMAAETIDRHALVTRHNPSVTSVDPLTPFSVGNGGFAFTADVTGLQTFPDAYEGGIPLHTMSDWAWHSMPNPHHYAAREATREYDVDGRKVPYLSGGGNRPDDYPGAANWLRANPQRIDLGRIGLILRHADGKPVSASELTDIRQTLDLWSGEVDSRFSVDGRPVHVRTACDPQRDVLAVDVDSPLLEEGRAGIVLAFPGASADWKATSDWAHPERHRTTVSAAGPHGCTITHTLDSTRYVVRVEWSDGADFRAGAEPHRYEITARGHGQLRLVCAFSPKRHGGALPTSEEVFTAAAEHWQKFWQEGGAVDLSGSTDPRWRELERRIVLSQYLTAVHCAGSTPPQETGLIANSWYGKFHLEMHWWHAAQFALWGRAALLEKSLAWYRAILPQARAIARAQGYAGARWPKMTDPSGANSPSQVSPFLIWQQPHPIYLAELCWRAHPDRATLDKYRQMVFETAAFMASYAAWDEATGRFVLGPQLIPAQESWGKYRAGTINPTFELAYWYWGLETAQQWRLRLGLKRNQQWDRVLAGLARPTVRDGVYAAVEAPDRRITKDHPAVLAAFGLVPATPLIDPAIMRRTLADVRKHWDWSSTWGWDYPMMAMTAARLGEPYTAVDLLLMDAPKNTYLRNGCNYQESRLPVYFPGNGGLLAAVALMAAGWDGAPTHDAPGFPHDGSWKVRSEGLLPLP
jgi:hypothetical protein